MSKQYESGQTLQQKIAKGIDVLADNVAATMGPRGRNVILHKEGSTPIITKAVSYTHLTLPTTPYV